jgi:quercetin dioxygenase-like cupin family protein
VLVAATHGRGTRRGGERLTAIREHRVNLRRCSVLALTLLLLAPVARAQTEPATAVRTPLAMADLPSVDRLPLYFRLYHAVLPKTQSTSYQGSNAMLYDLSGAAVVTLGGGAPQPLAQGAGAYLATGQEVTITAAEAEPAGLLLFVLTGLPNQRPPLNRPAAIRELFRTPEALPSLRAGPYEFSLTRVTFPAGMAPNPPQSRVGATLYCVIAGTGSLTSDGKTETEPTGASGIELDGSVFQWANPGDTPLVVLEVGISPEGEPAAHPAVEK